MRRASCLKWLALSTAGLLHFAKLLAPRMPLPPTLEFDDDCNYSNLVPNDGRTGTGQKLLILLDLAILEDSILPILIHDSITYGGMSPERLAIILSLYARQTKQVFNALDNQGTLNDEASEIVRAHTSIGLGEAPNSLFGFSSSDPLFLDHIDHGIPDSKLPSKKPRSATLF